MLRRGATGGLWARLVLVACLGLAGVAYAAAPGAGDASEGGIAATRDTQRLLSLGAQHSCAITDAGAVECWGDNSHGQLGTGDRTTSTKPRLVVGITGALQVGAGTHHTCALIQGGSVRCWGLNGSGQVGAGSDLDQLTPVAVAITGVRQLSVGGTHSCAVRVDGSVWCWGQNGMGQLGNGDPGGTSKAPVPVTGLDVTHPAVDVTAGENHTCARLEDGDRLVCWGHNGFGQLGDATTTMRSTPIAVGKPSDPGTQLTGVLAVSAGGGHTCALLGGDDWSDNPVYCWGQNSYGQLGHSTPIVSDGDPETPDRPGPSPVPLRVQVDTAVDPNVETDGPLKEAQSISSGMHHSCALVQGAEVRCWGQNGHGQLGSDHKPLTPKVWEDSRWAGPVPGLSAVAVAAGGFHSCALSGSQVKCWGYDFFGQLGGHVDPVPTPTTVTGVRGATTVAAVNDAACALVTDGVDPAVRPVCWGSNADGRLGVGTGGPVSTTVAVAVDLDDGVAGRESATSLHAGNGTFCAASVEVAAERCWGLNGHGELGDQTTGSRAEPGPTTHLAGVTAYDLGGTLVGGAERGTACKVGSGQALCWGYNGQGQVGDGTTTDRLTPSAVRYDHDDDEDTPMVPLPGVSAVAVGGDHACAIVGGGHVRCWGANGAGQLGTNDDDPRAGAVLVQQDVDPDEDEPLTGVTSLVAGDSHTCALRAGGEVRCWGLGSRGQLGTSGGSRNEADKVVRVVGPQLADTTETDLTDAVRLAAGDDHTCAIRASDSLTCWGENADGQLGIGATGGAQAVGRVTLEAPDTALPEGAKWVQQVSASRRNTCAVLLDRTVLCWGANNLGQVGDGIGTHSLTPVTVGGIGSVGTNHVPSPQDVTVTTQPGQAVVATIPLTGIDQDGDAVTLVSASDPPLGSVAVTPPGQVTYTPDDSGCHDDAFTYVVSDGTAEAAAVVHVQMNCAPVAVPDTATTPEDTQVDVDVVANDTDEDGDPLTLAEVTVAPAHGAATVVGGKVRYVPEPDVCAPPTDTLTYRVTDGHGHSATATLEVTVTCGNDGPAPGADAFAVPEDTPTVLDVVANDTDADGDPLAITAVSDGAHGATTTDGATVRYAPEADYCGPDSFTYTVRDGTASAEGSVTVSVLCAGDSPRADPEAVETEEDTALDVDVLANDTDPDGDTLTLGGALGQPAHGAVATVAGKVRYTPSPDYCGPDEFSYVVSDGALTATGSVTVQVACRPDDPDAAPDSATTDEDTTVHVHVLTNDEDPDGHPLRVESISDPANGTAVGAIDDAIAYTPDPDFHGTDSFTYRAVDPTGRQSAPVTVTVVVRAVDDRVALAAVPDQSLAWGDTLSVLFAGTDVDGDPISYSVSPLATGMDVTGAALTWTPGPAQVGSRQLTVTASAGGASATRTFSVAVGKRATTLAYTGPTTGQLSDATGVQASLVDAATLHPVPGKPVSFTLGGASTSASTADTGIATGALAVTGSPGLRTLSTSFAGDAAYLPSSDTDGFSVSREQLTVRLGGNPHVVVSGSSTSTTYVAELAEDADGAYVGALSTVAVTFKTLDGTTLCTGAVSSTGPGSARATCSALQSVGARAVVVSAVSPAYTPAYAVGVTTVANPGSGLSSGAGRADADAFGFRVVVPKKGAPAGSLVHIVGSAGSATVIESASLSTASTSCTGGGPAKECTLSAAAGTASARTVDLTTGAVGAPVAAGLSISAVAPQRYGATVTGPAPRTLPLSVILSGSVVVG